MSQYRESYPSGGASAPLEEDINVNQLQNEMKILNTGEKAMPPTNPMTMDPVHASQYNPGYQSMYPNINSQVTPQPQQQYSGGGEGWPPQNVHPGGAGGIYYSPPQNSSNVGAFSLVEQVPEGEMSGNRFPPPYQGGGPIYEGSAMPSHTQMQYGGGPSQYQGGNFVAPPQMGGQYYLSPVHNSYTYQQQPQQFSPYSMYAQPGQGVSGAANVGGPLIYPQSHLTNVEGSSGQNNMSNQITATTTVVENEDEGVTLKKTEKSSKSDENKKGFFSGLFSFFQKAKEPEPAAKEPKVKQKPRKVSSDEGSDASDSDTKAVKKVKTVKKKKASGNKSKKVKSQRNQRNFDIVENPEDLPRTLGRSKPLSKSDRQFKTIARYVTNGTYSQEEGVEVKIHQILEFDGSRQSAPSGSSGKSNKLLLWWKTTPGSAKRLGQKQDGCIAFYDIISRAYAAPPKKLDQRLRQTILLCSVSLGKMHNSPHGFRHWVDKDFPQGHDSVKGVGKLTPDRNDDRDDNSTVIPMGKVVEHGKYKNYEQDYSEYMIYEAKRVKIRYAVDLELIPVDESDDESDNTDSD